MNMHTRASGLTVIGGVAVFLCLLVAASFLADGRREPAMQLEVTDVDGPSGLDAKHSHWYASGQGPDDARKPPTWNDIIRSNYPTEPHYGPSEEQLYRQHPSSFEMRVLPGSGSMMLHTSPDEPNAMDMAKDRWYTAGKFDDHAREMHGQVPQMGKYVQAGYPSDYKSPSEFKMGAPEYALVRFLSDAPVVVPMLRIVLIRLQTRDVISLCECGCRAIANQLFWR